MTDPSKPLAPATADESSDGTVNAPGVYREKDCLLSARLNELRHEIRDGVGSGDGQIWDPEEIKREGRARLAERSSAK